MKLLPFTTFYAEVCPKCGGHNWYGPRYREEQVTIHSAFGRIIREGEPEHMEWFCDRCHFSVHTECKGGST